MLLNEEQAYLADTVYALVSDIAPASRMRELRDSADPLGYDNGLWEKLTEMGLPATAIPEEYEGLAFGYMGLGAAIQQMGRTLAASPLFATAVLGASAIELAGSETQKKELLPRIAAGELLVALAIDEGPHFNPAGCSTSLSGAKAFHLSGQKEFVLDGHVANLLVVVARSSESPGSEKGLSLVLVDPQKAGVKVERIKLMDGRNTATIKFDNVEITEHDLLGPLGQAWPVVQQVLDRGAVCMAAEMLGGAEAVFDLTIEYLKERVQFDVKIGSFQALQHRAAKMFCEIEMCRSTVLDALDALDTSPQDISVRASAAKALANDCFQHVTKEAVQMHGGMGVTDELDVGLYLKRAQVCLQILGDSAYHRDRFARLKGY